PKDRALVNPDKDQSSGAFASLADDCALAVAELAAREAFVVDGRASMRVSVWTAELAQTVGARLDHQCHGITLSCLRTATIPARLTTARTRANLAFLTFRARRQALRRFSMAAPFECPCARAQGRTQNSRTSMPRDSRTPVARTRN